MWHDYTVESVDHVNGMIFLKGEGCFKPHVNKNNVWPEEGDVIQIKTYRNRETIVGMRITGVKIRGEVLFDIDDREVDEQNRKRQEATDAELKQVFENCRYYERLALLPQWMQEKQAQLAVGLSDYLFRYGRYDLAILETAMMFLERAKTPAELKPISQLTPDALAVEFPKMETELTELQLTVAFRVALSSMAGVPYPHSGMCDVLSCEGMNCPAHRAKSKRAVETEEKV